MQLQFNVESSFGDVSSIMIMPDQLYNNFNLLEDEDTATGAGGSPNKQKKWVNIIFVMICDNLIMHNFIL